MDLITLDYESFYDPDNGYTLSKMTTEAYVRDPRFETIMVGLRVNDDPAFWVPGPQVAAELRKCHLERNAVLMHHAHFDGLILNHHYGIRPRVIFDTLGMARHLFGPHGRLSLAKLAERYGIGAKGDEVMNAKGMRLADFSPAALARYGAYCCNDVELTCQLFHLMRPQFSMEELQINDRVIRMFTEPVLELDTALLTDYAKHLRAEKILFMLQAGVQEADLMSNPKFAGCLEELGVEVPMKISPTWMKADQATRSPTPVLTYAFAKSDAAMQALQEHPDERVQILVEARLKNKTTIAEKGALRLVDMAGRGAATVYLKYSGAYGTHRLSGGDNFNWQSMKRGSDLRKAVKAPRNCMTVVVDSSTIEARWLDWLSGQDDMVEVYRRQDAKTGPDMYCVIGGMIYGYEITKATHPDERQMGKVAKLGLGFGMGHDKFMHTVRAQAKEKVLDADGNPVIDAGTGKPKEKPKRITPEFSRKVVDIYRDGHPQVRKLWKRGEAALRAIVAGNVGMPVDYRGIVKTCKDGLQLPGGIRILYPDLKVVKATEGPFEFEFVFWNGKARERIYGAKVIENIIQCLARITVFQQCLRTAKECEREGVWAPWVHSMHDEGIFVAHTFDAPWVLERLMASFRIPPVYAPDLPVNCEGGIHERYGLAKT